MSETLNNANKGLSDMVSSTGDGFTKAAANVGLGPAAAGPGPISPISNPLANPISSGPPPLTSSTGNAAGFKDFMESNEELKLNYIEDWNNPQKYNLTLLFNSSNYYRKNRKKYCEPIKKPTILTKKF